MSKSLGVRTFWLSKWEILSSNVIFQVCNWKTTSFDTVFCCYFLDYDSELSCPYGTEQVGTLTSGNDISGCGMDNCKDRYNKTSIEDCAQHCKNTKGCKAFNWAPVGGDRSHPQLKVCGIYSSNVPSGSYGPKYIFCRPHGLWHLTFYLFVEFRRLKFSV